MATRRTGRAIAAAARSYEGRWSYVFGGAPAPPRRLEGDCSSFVTTVLGYNLRLALPGGKWGQPGFPPNSHGPVVLDYATWAGARTVGTPQAGDLCVFAGAGANGHIGIAVSSDRMVSALNPQQGCVETPIVGYGPPGAPLIYRRILGVPEGLPELASAASSAASGANPVAALLVAATLGLVAVAVVAVGVPLVIAGGVALVKGATS